MHPIIVYLDETISPTIILKKSDSGIKVTSGSNIDYKSKRKLALASLRRELLFSGVFIPPIGSDFSAPGTGYHFGASFPMGTASDNLGRIEDWQNIHIVDSSVLPYLEVGSITPTVMANAHRIARLSVSK
jgi:choline dehydrogenase-like flavoprotein